MSMNSIQRTFHKEADGINRKYGQLMTDLASVGQKAADIGEILHRVKTGLKHGEFEAWVKANLKFGIRQAQKYLQFHAQLPDEPDRELLAEQWRELTYPRKRTDCALLPTSDLASEPDEPVDAPAYAPAPGEKNLGFIPRDGHHLAVALLRDPDVCPGFVRLYVVDCDDDTVAGVHCGVGLGSIPGALRHWGIDGESVSWLGSVPLHGGDYGWAEWLCVSCAAHGG